MKYKMEKFPSGLAQRIALLKCANISIPDECEWKGRGEHYNAFQLLFYWLKAKTELHIEWIEKGGKDFSH